MHPVHDRSCRRYRGKRTRGPVFTVFCCSNDAVRIEHWRSRLLINGGFLARRTIAARHCRSARHIQRCRRSSGRNNKARTLLRSRPLFLPEFRIVSCRLGRVRPPRAVYNEGSHFCTSFSQTRRFRRISSRPLCQVAERHTLRAS